MKKGAEAPRVGSCLLELIQYVNFQAYSSYNVTLWLPVLNSMYLLRNQFLCQK